MPVSHVSRESAKMLFVLMVCKFWTIQSYLKAENVKDHFAHYTTTLILIVLKRYLDPDADVFAQMAWLKIM